MSGGSMEYLYRDVQDASFVEDTPLRRAFRAHLDKVAAALRAIEWVDSRDSARGSEDAAILAVVGEESIVEAAVEHRDVAIRQFEECIEALRALDVDGETGG